MKTRVFVGTRSAPGRHQHLNQGVVATGLFACYNQPVPTIEMIWPS